jgi:hypothetical protein
VSDVARFELALLTTLASRSADEIRGAIAGLKAQLASPAGPAGARAAVKRIASSYRPEEAIDPKALFADMAEAIEDFPARVIADLQDPKVGIIRVSKFRPVPAELVEWCEGRLRDYERALERAQEVLWRHERADLERAAAEAAETQWIEREAREAEAARLEADVQATLAAMPQPHNRPLRIGEQRARQAWEWAMAKALRSRADLVDPCLAILADNPDLRDFATTAENRYARTGWSELSKRLFNHPGTRGVQKGDSNSESSAAGTRSTQRPPAGYEARGRSSEG